MSFTKPSSLFLSLTPHIQSSSPIDSVISTVLKSFSIPLLCYWYMLSSLPHFAIGLYSSVLQVLCVFFFTQNKRNLLSHSSRTLGRLKIWNQVISRAVFLWKLQRTIYSLLLLAPGPKSSLTCDFITPVSIFIFTWPALPYVVLQVLVHIISSRKAVLTKPSMSSYSSLCISFSLYLSNYNNILSFANSRSLLQFFHIFP